jgi:dual specificity MAP kinase phosphatase
MTEASEISTNVWQGPTPEYLLKLKARETACDERFDLLIEANDLASIPPPHVLDHLERKLKNGPQRLEFPSSGSLMPPSSGPGEQRELDNFVNTIRWMHYLANSDGSAGESDSEGDIPMVTSSRKPYKILIHGPDGYTESSLLALAAISLLIRLMSHTSPVSKSACSRKALPRRLLTCPLFQNRLGSITVTGPSQAAFYRTCIWAA